MPSFVVLYYFTQYHRLLAFPGYLFHKKLTTIHILTIIRRPYRTGRLLIDALLITGFLQHHIAIIGPFKDRNQVSFQS